MIQHSISIYISPYSPLAPSSSILCVCIRVRYAKRKLLPGAALQALDPKQMQFEYNLFTEII